MHRTPLLVVLACTSLCISCAESVREGSISPAHEVASVETVALPLSEFHATFDPATGRFAVETAPIDASSIQLPTEAAAARLEELLACRQDSAPVVLRADADSVRLDPQACGFADEAPYADGTFCVNVDVISQLDSALRNVTVEIFDRQPFEVAAFPVGFGTSHDPASLPGGRNHPNGAGGGLFAHGDAAGVIAPGQAANRMWALQYPAGTGAFRVDGRIWAEVSEVCPR